MRNVPWDQALDVVLQAKGLGMVRQGNLIRVAPLAQLLLKLTSPGVPDLYQGTELWDLSLVDPDNRRPVDFRLREQLLDALFQAFACIFLHLLLLGIVAGRRRSFLRRGGFDSGKEKESKQKWLNGIPTMWTNSYLSSFFGRTTYMKHKLLCKSNERVPSLPLTWLSRRSVSLVWREIAQKEEGSLCHTFHSARFLSLRARVGIIDLLEAAQKPFGDALYYYYGQNLAPG